MKDEPVGMEEVLQAVAATRRFKVDCEASFRETRGWFCCGRCRTLWPMWLRFLSFCRTPTKSKMDEKAFNLTCRLKRIVLDMSFVPH